MTAVQTTEPEVSGMPEESNIRIRDLEGRMSRVEADLSAILTRLDTLTSLAKGVLILAGAALGVDVLPMLGAA